MESLSLSGLLGFRKDEKAVALVNYSLSKSDFTGENDKTQAVPRIQPTYSSPALFRGPLLNQKDGTLVPSMP